MIITHFILGFITSYLGFTPPSMLNLTVSKIFLEKDKKAAYQFILGVSIVVLIQFFLSFMIVSFVDGFPNLLFWMKNIAIIVFAFISLFFLKKGIVRSNENEIKKRKNNFIYGMLLSFINVFAIPFFTITYSLLVLQGFINTTFVNSVIFALGVFLGTIAVLVSYVFLMEKFKRKNMVFLTKYINPVIGLITGFFAIYTAVKLYI